MKITPERTVGSIVADDFRTAAVFNAMASTSAARAAAPWRRPAARKGIDQKVIEQEITARCSTATRRPIATSRPGRLGRLVEHIERVHHRYIEARTPTIQQFLEKLCRVHGDRHPELFDIATEFNECCMAMAAHMKKEELILFPFIVRQLEQAEKTGEPAPMPPFGTVENPVHMMMDDHETEGERFRRIAAAEQRLPDMPADGCATYATAMAMLKEFEQDLHLHIHLENNIMFPRAVALEKKLARAVG
jgi:regulator of cell morphogenesis and NO signaling